MVMISEDTLKSIRSNYGEEKPNESFLKDVLCNIVDDNNFLLGDSLLPYCDDEQVQSFWKNNLEKYDYIHLFPYLVLKLWQNQNPESELLEKWIESYEDEFYPSLTKEIELFISNIASIGVLPPLYVVDVGYIIDSFEWRRNKVMPYFTEFAYNKNLFSDALYDRYVLLLCNSLETWSQKLSSCDLLMMLEYLKTTDIIVRKKACLTAIAERLSGKESSKADLTTMLMSIPHNRCDFDTYKKMMVFYSENYDLYRDQSCFSFCDNSNEVAFWKENASVYSYVLLYLILQEWNDESGTPEELNCWLDQLFSADNSVLLEEEMRTLKPQLVDMRKAFAKSIVEKIGFAIEEYFWKKNYETPSLIQSVDISSLYVNKYQRLLLDDAKKNPQNFIDKIDCYLQFCLVLDAKETFARSNLMELLAITYDGESEQLGEILVSYPYYGDDFGLSLLHFCKKNRSFYKLSKQAISKYEHHLCVDSWMSVMQEKLGESGKPYTRNLCMETSSYMRIVEFINSRHSIFWDQCNQMATQVVREVKNLDPAGKREPVRDGIKTRTRELIKEEKELIYNNIKTFLSDSLKEGILLFINETKEEEEFKGRRLNLTDKALQVIYKYLVDKYANKPLPNFSFEPSASCYEYADRVARVWVFWIMLAEDSINESYEVTDEQRKSIREKFETHVWKVIEDDVLGWCKSYYYSSSDTSGSSSSYSFSSRFSSIDTNDLPYYVTEPYTG